MLSVQVLHGQSTYWYVDVLMGRDDSRLESCIMAGLGSG